MFYFNINKFLLYYIDLNGYESQIKAIKNIHRQLTSLFSRQPVFWLSISQADFNMCENLLWILLKWVLWIQYIYDRWYSSFYWLKSLQMMLKLPVSISQFEYHIIIIFSYIQYYPTSLTLMNMNMTLHPLPLQEKEWKRKPIDIMEVLKFHVTILIWLDEGILWRDIWNFPIRVIILCR